MARRKELKIKSALYKATGKYAQITNKGEFIIIKSLERNETYFIPRRPSNNMLNEIEKLFKVVYHND